MVNQDSCKKVKIYNLSKFSYSFEELEGLTLGPKFVPATSTDTLQHKIDVLNFSRKLLLRAHFFESEYSDPSLIKHHSSFIPKSTKYPTLKSVIEDLELYANGLDNVPRTPIKDNLTSQQREGIHLIRNNPELLFFNSDKGSVPVLLNKDFYQQKMLEKLYTDNYVMLPRNVDYFIHTRVKVFTKKYEHCLTKSERLAITKFDFQPTNIYGLPKIHKSVLIKNALKSNKEPILHFPDPRDLSFRVIFGGPKNPLTGLASLINIILNPFLVKVRSLVLNSVDFITKLPIFSSHDLPFIQMWVVDVTDMYNSLDNKFGLEALSFWLTKYPDLKNPRFSTEFILSAMKLILENNVGYFAGNFFKQVNGTATGIKPAPPYANLAMGYLEILLFHNLSFNLGPQVACYFWRHFRRYLDDGQIMWDTRLGNFKEVLFYLNRVNKSIKFTASSSNSEIIFLDVRIFKTDSGFETMVFSKVTDADNYLNFLSCHPRHTKENIPFNLARRVRTLTDDNVRCEKEMDALAQKLANSNFPLGMIRTAIKSAFNHDPKELRLKSNSNESSEEDGSISFVHFYDPSLPKLFSEVKTLISRIFTSGDLRPIFAGVRIVDSLREPASLTRTLQHSRFNGSSDNVPSTVVPMAESG